MLKKTVIYGVGILSSLALSPAFMPSANASILMTDRWTSDSNVITSQQPFSQSLLIFEDYGEDNLIPYPSHNGYAVVDNSYPSSLSCPSSICFFDKIVDLNGASGTWNFIFSVANVSPFDWSDYHFEIYDSTFTNPLALITSAAQTGPFQNVDTVPLSAPYSQVNFYKPDYHVIGDTWVYNLALDFSLLEDGETSFGIRQVATTVPEPLTLLGASVAIAFGAGFKKRKQQD